MSICLCRCCLLADLLKRARWVQEFIDLEMDAYRNNVIRVRTALWALSC